MVPSHSDMNTKSVALINSVNFKFYRIYKKRRRSKIYLLILSQVKFTDIKLTMAKHRAIQRFIRLTERAWFKQEVQNFLSRLKYQAILMYLRLCFLGVRIYKSQQEYKKQRNLCKETWSITILKSQDRKQCVSA